MVAFGDEQEKQLRSGVLRALVEAHPKGDPLREMAQAVLAGELSLRQAASSDIYGDALIEAYEKAGQARQGWDERQQADIAAQADMLLAASSEPKERP